MLALFASISRKHVTGIGLRCEESRRRLDLALFLRAPALAPQPPRLHALLRAQPFGATGVDVALATPVAQRLIGHTQLIGDLLRPGSEQLDCLFAEFRRTRRSGFSAGG